MIIRHFNQAFQKLLFFVLASMLPFVANSGTEEVIGEKRIEVAMRMIGHEVLTALGDHESRIMPIEKINEQYKISFEFEFGFDPDEIISIVDRVMTEARISTDYLVEVEQCETKAVVHSFEIRSATSDLIPCRGRMLPEDCYSLLITILDDTSPRLPDDMQAAANLLSAPNGSSNNVNLASEQRPSSFSPLTAFIVLLLISTGLMIFLIRKKHLRRRDGQAAGTDLHLVPVGASQFDKRNMVLSYEDKSVELSSKEAELLSLLHTNANTPVTREVMLQSVWGDEGDYVGRTLDVFISKLRKKLKADASVKIVNIRGIGYKLVMDVPK